MRAYRKRIPGTIGVVCTVVFVVFSLVFLGWQSELMMYSQKVLSGGMTSYNPEVGSILITGILLLVTYILYRFIAPNLYFLPALYFLPSLLILATLTDQHIMPDGGLEEGCALVWMIVVTALLLVFSFILGRVKFISDIRNSQEMAACLFINTLLMVCGCFLAAILSNTNRTEHVNLVSEHLVEEGKYDEAVELIDVNVNADDDADKGYRHAVMIKALALSKEGKIGDRFFECPMPTTSSRWLYPSKENKLLLISGKKYFRQKNADYKLLSSMLDRDLPKFASNMKEIYGDSIPQQLPRYYKEALIAYKHTSVNLLIDYSDNAMEEDFNDFHQILKKHNSVELRDLYGDTYWWYFFK